MKADAELLEQLDRYLDGHLSASGMQALEASMAADPELLELKETLEVARLVVIGHETGKLRTQIQNDLAGRSGIVYKVAGSAFLLLGIATAGYIWYSGSHSNLPQATILKETILIADTVQRQPAAPEALPLSVSANSERKRSVDLHAGSERLEQPSAAVVIPEKPSEISVTKSEHVLVATEEPALKSETPCKEFLPDIQHVSSPSCSNSKTGEIRIREKSGTSDKAHYRYSIDTTQGFGAPAFTQLAPGNYTLFVKDNKGCLFQYPAIVTIGSMVCAMSRKDYSFAPDLDQPWPIPYEAGKQASAFRITDRNGRIVFSSPVENNYPESWNGQSNTGNVPDIGYHLFTVEYKDGSSDRGSITILR